MALPSLTRKTQAQPRAAEFFLVTIWDLSRVFHCYTENYEQDYHITIIIILIGNSAGGLITNFVTPGQPVTKLIDPAPLVVESSLPIENLRHRTWSATVKQIVGQDGGSITIQSELGQGTCVAIRLPTANTKELAA